MTIFKKLFIVAVMITPSLLYAFSSSLPLNLNSPDVEKTIGPIYEISQANVERLDIEVVNKISRELLAELKTSNHKYGFAIFYTEHLIGKSEAGEDDQIKVGTYVESVFNILDHQDQSTFSDQMSELFNQLRVEYNKSLTQKLYKYSKRVYDCVNKGVCSSDPVDDAVVVNYYSQISIHTDGLFSSERESVRHFADALGLEYHY